MTNTFEIDITRANDLIAQWGLIAQSIARQCKWRPRGKCLDTCLGIAVCNLDGLTLVDHQGRPIALPASPWSTASGIGVPPMEEPPPTSGG